MDQQGRRTLRLTLEFPYPAGWEDDGITEELRDWVTGKLSAFDPIRALGTTNFSLAMVPLELEAEEPPVYGGLR